MAEKKNKSSAVAEMGDRGHNRHGRKEGGAAVPLSRTAGTTSNTMWPVSRSTSRPARMPSFILIHPTVWPQYTNVTDRQDRRDRQTTDR